MSLSRDDAKQVFSTRDAELLPSLIRQLRAAADGTNRLLDCGNWWLPLHRCLTGDASDGGQPPLNQTFLGGRRLLPEGDAVVVLVRPDMVPHVRDVLQSLDDEWLARRHTESVSTEDSAGISVDDLRDCLEKVSGFYAAAAAASHCVVFSTV